MSSPLRTIKAKYRGKCEECRDEIEVGDTVIYDTENGTVYCEPCGKDLDLDNKTDELDHD